MSVLDFGCGPGSYVIPAAQMVTESGRIYALDIRQTALTMVRDRALKLGLANVGPSSLIATRACPPPASTSCCSTMSITTWPPAIILQGYTGSSSLRESSPHDHHLGRDVLKKAVRRAASSARPAREHRH